MHGTTFTLHAGCGPRLAGVLLVLLGLGGCGGGGDWAADTSGTQTSVVAGTATPGPASSAPTSSEEPGVVIRRQPTGVEVPEGGVALFSVDAGGARAVTYQWLRDDEAIEGETGAVLQLKVTPADHLARISVIVRSGRSTLHSDPALLRVGRG